MRANTTDIGLLVIRLTVGLILMYHGAQKLFGWFGGPGLEGFSGFLESIKAPAPYVSAVGAAVVEFFGGLALVIGLLVRWASIPIVVVMLVACSVHWPVFSAPGQQNAGYEFALTLAMVTAGLGLTGAGKLSLDGLRKSPAAL